MRFLQANMHRGKVAHSLLGQIVYEEGADIVIISEQYKSIETGKWVEDESKTASIWLPSSKQAIDQSGYGNGFSWIVLDNLTIVSCYLTPSDHIDSFQQKLDDIEDFTRHRDGDIIIAGDFNSRAVEWGMPTTDPRGKRIIDPKKMQSTPSIA